MEATIAQLTREMEDARISVEKCQYYINHWEDHRKDAYNRYEKLKLQLKTLTDAKPQL